ncbi:hypothetical protein [Saccharopolyspora cebuensis]|uniref:Uncharacterized protein n=1 Tax=Saccharopolyspora cebuensis TaxID=418759 RepID=A0ABV4CGB1_9PSEU
MSFGRFLPRVLVAAVAAISLSAMLSPAVNAAQSPGRSKAYFTVDTLEVPGGRVNGRIFAGHIYATYDFVEGPAIPPGTCGTDNPGNAWRPVVLPSGQIGYTSVYCIM